MENTAQAERELAKTAGGLNQVQLAQVREITQKYQDYRGSLIMVLHDIQDKFGYLPEDALHVVSDETGIPMTEIFGVATFYSFFSLEPKGEHVIRVCLGTACYVKGSQEILDKLQDSLHIKVGQTTEDGKISLESMRCLGACGLAPVVAIEDEVHGKVTSGDIPKILKSYEREEG